MSSCDNPPGQQDDVMSRRPKYDKTRLCVKCRLNAGSIVIRHAVYCKDCFFPHISIKFRRSLDPFVNDSDLDIPGANRRQKALKASGNLFVGFSGGLGSTVLLDLVSKCYFQGNSNGKKSGTQNDLDTTTSHLKGGKDHPRNQNAWKNAFACYVEVSSAFSGMRDRTADARAVVEQYGVFEFIPLRIEDAFDHEWWEAVGGRPTMDDLGMDITSEDIVISHTSSKSSPLSPVAALHAYISSLPTQTSIPTAITNLIRLLLLYTAKSRSSSHVLLGTSLTSLSISLISSIGQGGGVGVREEVGEVWSPGQTLGSDPEKKRTRIHINRPLREVGMKECAIWAWWNDLRVIGRDRFAGGKHGIGALTRDFIVGLEQDYPSTVSTIARTCGKLTPKVAILEEGETAGACCAWCERPTQPGIMERWKNRIAIRSFGDTATISAAHPHAPPSLLEFLLPSDDTDDPPEPNEESPPPGTTSLAPYLCYACHTMLTSRSSRGTAAGLGTGSSVPLPVWVRAHMFAELKSL